ncbi:hypothetical protein GQ42DRAFT_104199, partial [Ramicandelaber brevisporus]
CSRCREPLGASYVVLNDGCHLHNECFRCAECNLGFEDGFYIPDEGKFYHSRCLEQLQSSRQKPPVNQQRKSKCDRCQQEMRGPCFHLSNGRQYHPHCFHCAGCHRQFDEGSYVSSGGKEYHRHCLPESETTRCVSCSSPINGPFVRHAGRNYHSHCFVCSSCKREIPPGTYVDFNGTPCCETCVPYIM